MPSARQLIDQLSESDAVQRIIARVEGSLGDVIVGDRSAEDPNVPASEECWTLCIDAANDIIGRGPSAIKAAKRACAELGYPQKGYRRGPSSVPARRTSSGTQGLVAHRPMNARSVIDKLLPNLSEGLLTLSASVKEVKYAGEKGGSHHYWVLCDLTDTSTGKRLTHEWAIASFLVKVEKDSVGDFSGPYLLSGEEADMRREFATLQAKRPSKRFGESDHDLYDRLLAIAEKDPEGDLMGYIDLIADIYNGGIQQCIEHGRDFGEFSEASRFLRANGGAQALALASAFQGLRRSYTEAKEAYDECTNKSRNGDGDGQDVDPFAEFTEDFDNVEDLLHNSESTDAVHRELLSKLNVSEGAHSKAEGIPDGIQSKPPVQCDFKVGDKVTFTNDYGVSFKGHVVTGFTEDVTSWGAFIYLDTEAWWYPHKPSQLKLEK